MEGRFVVARLKPEFLSASRVTVCLVMYSQRTAFVHIILHALRGDLRQPLGARRGCMG